MSHDEPLTTELQVMRMWQRWVGAVVFSVPALAGAQNHIYSAGDPGYLGDAFSMPTGPYIAMPVNFGPDEAVLTAASIYTSNGYNVPNGGLLGPFTWTIFTDDGTGLPGGAYATGTSTPTPGVRDGFEFWRFDLPSVQLAANTRYWVSVAMPATNPDNPNLRLQWRPTYPARTGPAAFFNGSTGEWYRGREYTDAEIAMGVNGFVA